MDFYPISTFARQLWIEFGTFLKNCFHDVTNIAVGPLGFQAEVDIDPKGEKSILPRAGSAGRADSTSILDEDNPEPPWIPKKLSVLLAASLERTKMGDR